jgi:hypothetical protein
MSTPIREEQAAEYAKVDDPEIEARRYYLSRVLRDGSIETKQQVIAWLDG